MTRRPTVPPRTPIFLGCEGASERGYAALLNQILHETPGLNLHIHAELLQPGAGDPLALVQRAVQKIADIERRRQKFAHKAILLDVADAGKGAAAQQLAAKQGISHLIWQNPAHEAFLLRHFDGCQALKPPTKAASMAELRKHWPDYDKAQTRLQLAGRLTMAHIRQARGVEPDLDAFLAALGVS